MVSSVEVSTLGLTPQCFAVDSAKHKASCFVRHPELDTALRETRLVNFYLSEELALNRGPTDFERPTEMTTETYQYRGYDIVPMWQWSSWCAGVYATRAELPILSQSTLSTMASRKDEAVAEAKHCIDDMLSR